MYTHAKDNSRVRDTPFFDSDNPLVTLNEKLHSSSFYNAFQIGVNAFAVFSGATYLSMKNRMKIMHVY